MLDENHGLLFPAGEGGTKGILYAQAADVDRRMEEAEAGRLLYVAATRAQELLILSGTARVNADGIPQPENWLQTLAATLGLDQPIAAATASLANEAPTNMARVRTEETLVTLYRQSPEAPAQLASAVKPDGPPSDAPPAAAKYSSQPVAPPLLSPLRQLQGAQVILDGEEGTQAETEHETLAQGDDGTPRRNRRTFLQQGALPLYLFQQSVGTLFHSALQWGHNPDQASFAPWLESALDRYDIVDGGERKAVGDRVRALLERYYRSDLHREVAASPVVMREVEYIALASAVGGDATAGSPQRAQQENLFEATPAARASGKARPNGRIDLIFRRPNGAWAIVDFKVDQIVRVKDTLRHLEPRTDYLQQLRYYREAFATLTGEKAEALLCLLDDKGAMTLHTIV